MELLRQSYYKTPTNQTRNDCSSGQKSIQNISSYQHRNTTVNGGINLMGESSSNQGLSEVITNRTNDVNTGNYPLNMSIMMSIPFLPSPRIVRSKAIKLVREKSTKLKSRNMFQTNKGLTNHAFIKLSIDNNLNYNNNINGNYNNNSNSMPSGIIPNGKNKNISNNRMNDNKLIWKSKFTIEKEPLESIQGITSRRYPRKPFNSEEFLKIVKKYSENQSDMTINLIPFKNELEKLKHHISKQSNETIDKSTIALHESQSEKNMLIRHESDLYSIRNMTPQKRQFLINLDKLNKQRLLLSNFNKNKHITLDSARSTIPMKTKRIDNKSLKMIFKNKRREHDNKDNLINQKSDSLKKEVSTSQTPSGLNGNMFSKKDLLFENKSEYTLKLNKKKTKTFESLMNDIGIIKERLNSLLLSSNRKDYSDNINGANCNNDSKPRRNNNNSKYNTVNQNLRTIQSLPEISINENDQHQQFNNKLNHHDNRKLILTDNREPSLNKNVFHTINNDKQSNNSIKEPQHNYTSNNKQIRHHQIKSDDFQTKEEYKNNALKDKGLLFTNQVKSKHLIRGNTTSKQSDLKTDTDTKGRSSKYQNTTELKQIVSSLVADLKPKESNNTNNFNINSSDGNTLLQKNNNNNNKHQKITTELSSITSKADFCKSQISHHTNTKQCDFLSKMTSLRNIDDKIIRSKHNLLNKAFTRYTEKQLISLNNKHQSTKRVCYYSSSAQNIQMQLRDKKDDAINEIDIDYGLFQLKPGLTLSFSIGNYISRKYMIIDSTDFSDYLFQKKTDFWMNNIKNKRMRRVHTMKSTTFVNPDAFNEKAHTEKNILVVQKFIQNDSTLSTKNIGNIDLNNLLLDYNNTLNYASEHNIAKSKKHYNRPMTTIHSPPNQLTLDILKHKPFFYWRQDDESKSSKIQHLLKLVQVPRGMRVLIKEVRILF